MKFSIVAIGRLKQTPEGMIIQKYISRASKQIQLIEIDPPPAGPLRQQKETKALLNALPSGAFPIVLDERGLQLSTREFHQLLKEKVRLFGPHIAFLMGGAEGFSPEQIPSSWPKICLGKMTWPHALARVLLTEQLYRILLLEAGHPYHKD